MSGAVQRPGAPPLDDIRSNGHHKVGVPSSNGGPSHSLSYPAEASDDVNMNQVDGLVTLAVTLPSGQQADMNVDYNTPMRDLLILLAAKSKLVPSGLTLQLVDEESDNKPMSYKPSQTIGALGGRSVVILAKGDKGKSNNVVNRKASTTEKPFEMTHRFTMNLPRGQKAVVRVSPLTVLGDLVTSVCQDKNLDLRRHVLQIPGQPGRPVDLRASIQQVGVHEMNLITVPLQPGGSHTQSMPDLSKPVPQDGPSFPSYMPGMEQPKKKRGFLSFLKKDKSSKFKPGQANYNNIETSSTTSHMMSEAQARRGSTPPSQRRSSIEPQRPMTTVEVNSRPMSMFVGKQPTSGSNGQPPQPSQPASNQPTQIQSQTLPKKKRRAPAPPAPPPSAQNKTSQQQQQPPTLNVSTFKPDTMDNSRITEDLNLNSKDLVVSSTAQVSRAEMLSRLHSRNSSDSSGYHELTLSGCDSPEATLHLPTKSKTSIDSTSIESTDNVNGDSGIHESPIRVSPIKEVQEKSDSPALSSVSSSSVDTLQRGKRKKAAPPPPPVTPRAPELPSTPPPTHQALSSAAVQEEVVAAVVEVTQSVPDSQATSQEPPEPSEVTSVDPSQDRQMSTQQSADLSQDDTRPTWIHESASIDTPASVDQGTCQLPDSALVSDDEDESKAFDINDILEGVVFDEEPKTMGLTLTTGGDGGMMMEETGSVVSEDVGEEEVYNKSERPCAFVPPPPPSEPPPPGSPDINMSNGLDLQGPTLVDKETGLNDDNTSLAPSSAMNSPGTSTGPYKNEMAMFVERMSVLAVENPHKEDALDESLSSLSFLGSDTNSDTGSVIHHGSDKGSLTRKDGKIISANVGSKPETVHELAGDCAVSEEMSAPIEIVPPPPDFGDMGDGKEEEVEEVEEVLKEVEEFVVSVESIDIRATQHSEVSKQPEKDIKRENNNGVFLAQPVVITQIPSSKNNNIPIDIEPKVVVTQKPKPVEQTPKKLDPAKSNEKEDFVLTFDDLAGVSFKPTTPKLSRTPRNTPRQIQKEISREPEFVRESVSADKQRLYNTVYNPEPEYSSVKQHMSHISFKPKTEAENHSLLEEKPISLLTSMTSMTLPSMRPPGHAPLVHTFSDDSPSGTPVQIASSHSNSMNSSRKSSLGHDIDDPHMSLPSPARSPVSPVSPGMDDRPGSSATLYSTDTVDPSEVIQQQYLALQSQMEVWKGQLARNQTLISAQASGPDMKVDQLKQMTEQMAMQQQMMMTLQNSMAQLQMQQGMVQPQVNGLQGSRTPSPVEDATPPPPPAAVAPLPPPPPPQVEQPTPIKSLKSSLVAPKPRPKSSRFERQLDPREELMIAIRSFKGRQGLESVPVTKAKWVHSNRL